MVVINSIDSLINLFMQPYFLIFAIPILGAVISVIIAKFSPIGRSIFAISMTGVSAALAAMLLLGQQWNEYIIEFVPSLGAGQYFQNSIVVDPLSALVALVAAFLGFLIAVFSLEYMKGDDAETRYWFFLQLFIGGMVLLVLAGDMVLLYFGWKIVGVCSYFLIGHWFHKPGEQGELCAKSGIKAFMMTLVGDIFLLGGLGVIWFGLSQSTVAGTVPSINLGYIALHFVEIPDNLQILAALMVFAGAVGKSAQFPLITWLSSPRSVNIDAMQGPTTVSALIHAATMVKAGVYLISRFFFIFAAADIEIFVIAISLVAVITAFIAAASALVAIDIKRVLAYSTVSQLAYMFMGLAVAFLAYNDDHHISFEGFVGTQFHLLSHAIFKALLFLSAGAIIHSLNSERNIKKMGGLKNELPIMHWVTLIGVCALAGIPFLFNGGYSKETILTSAFVLASSGTTYAIFGLLIWVIGLVTALMTAMYAFRFFFLIFYGEKPADLKVHPPGPIMKGITGLLAGLVILTGIGGVFFLNDYFHALFTKYGITDYLGPLAFFPGTFEGIVTLFLAVVLVAIGIFISYTIYFKGNRTVMPIVKKNIALNFCYVVAKEGFYLDRLYTTMIGFFHWANWKLRNLQTGDLNINMSLLGAVALSVVVLLLFL